MAEISQTHASGNIILGYTNLENHGANGLGFTLNQTPTNIISAAIGAKGSVWPESTWNKKWFLVPGTGTVDVGGPGGDGSLPETAANATPYFIQQTALLHDIAVSTYVSLGNSIIYAKMYCNAIVTPFLTLSLTGQSKITRDTTKSYRVVEGDQIFIEISGVYVTNPNLRSVVFDYGII